MEIEFWGVRGSLPAPGPDTSQFGGNTPCVEVRNGPSEPLVILDGGTGIRKLGMDILSKPDINEIHVFFSHTHWDHIQGLPFFAPLFNPKYTIGLYGPVHYSKNLEETLSLQMEYTYFPVRVAELASNLKFHDISEQEISIGSGITVKTKYVNHPVICLSYRITCNGKSFVYLTDHEPYRNLFADGDEIDREEGRLVAQEQSRALIDFVAGADLLCIDAQYTPEEYATKIGWGHSSLDDAYKLAQDANVGEIVLFHHDPDRVDADLQKMLTELQDRAWEASHNSIPVRLAREHLVISL